MKNNAAYRRTLHLLCLKQVLYTQIQLTLKYQPPGEERAEMIGVEL